LSPPPYVEVPTKRFAFPVLPTWREDVGDSTSK
jgi:hypothetical protein